MNLLFRLMTRLLAGQQPEMLPVDGARLQRAGEQCWVADRELSYGGRSRFPIRMVVLRDQAGGLTLYSPVVLEEGTREALAGLGEVLRIVAPNRFHTLFAGRALDAYPNATLLVPEDNAGLAERFPARTRIVRNHVEIVPGLELYPVRQRDEFSELAGYHDFSESLLLADLMFNFQQAASRLERFGYRMSGIWQRPGHSRLQRLLLLKDVPSIGGFYRWALAKPFSQIIMAHGQVVADDAREVFYQAFSRFGAAGSPVDSQRPVP